MKLWKKGVDSHTLIEKFTVGNDYVLDMTLLPYDCIASQAHARMLCKIGILTKQEEKKINQCLTKILKLSSEDAFVITPQDEDCHTAIENFLTKELGETGKKIHTARSRNDQVLTALRLYEKDELKKIKIIIQEYKGTLKKIISPYGKIPIPGYTHMQKAMPSSITMWLGSYIDSIEDTLILIDSVDTLIDQSPLGSAAGFGVPIFSLDKKMTAKEMGFSKVMDNPMYCQLSRGKFEATLIHMMTQILFDLNKLSTDLMLFSMKEFGYVELPEEFCTGSSIMPQKKNPDVLELVRAKYFVILGEEMKVQSIIGNLMSGYNRDLQLTKEPIIVSFETTKACLEVMSLVLSKIKINESQCKKAMTPELFATEEAYKLVKKGVPFREAYRTVGKKYSK